MTLIKRNNIFIFSKAISKIRVTSKMFEYRAFNKESKDDFANVWLRVQYQKKFGAFKAYAKIQPKFAIDRDGYDDGEYYEAQNNYGVDYKVSDKLSVGVYLEQNTDDDWNVKSEFIATKVSCKF